MQKPFDINIRGTTIDANEQNRISWRISGDVSVAYKIDILSNLDNSLIYTTSRINSYSTNHSLSPTLIENGKEYKLLVTVYNQANSQATSDPIIFQTSSRPNVSIAVPNQINSPTYLFEAEYTQAEGLPIRNHIFYVYNSNQSKIHESGLTTSEVLQFLVNNLSSQANYFIEVQVTSSRGLTNTTGKIPFYVLYTRPQTNVQLKAENVDNAGIKLSWKVIQIIGQSNCEELNYIDNQKIDLRDSCHVEFDEGFTVDNDYTLKLWIENPIKNKEILNIRGSNGYTTLSYIDNQFHLLKHINGMYARYVSEKVDSDTLFVFIQQVNDDYNLKASEVV
ncbi:hypothetical protein PQ478_08390 [Alkalihalophilus pseudofirmus]|uniref:hypothetical protein n=1 Tax=Alkalihalophilus pseudofirmus TaxID=79885 RepID=UPI00259B7922|nr:hypothetical protein [Alkalihalophilus pseudofirmus]WEG18487.1 hypothetical protein PQ478_08390 [Alkalihalophilus pseudofirmus]